MIAYIIYQIKDRSNVAVTLSLGSEDLMNTAHGELQGADRYLLKHETANPNLYSTYHLKQKLEDRLSHLRF